MQDGDSVWCVWTNTLLMKWLRMAEKLGIAMAPGLRIDTGMSQFH